MFSKLNQEKIIWIFIVLVPSLYWAWQVRSLSNEVSLLQQSGCLSSSSSSVVGGSSSTSRSSIQSLYDCHQTNEAALNSLNQQIRELRQKYAKEIESDQLALVKSQRNQNQQKVKSVSFSRFCQSMYPKNHNTVYFYS
jgi:hypothetical protein